MVDALRDPVVEMHGYSCDSDYVETFWLPILGPTATWLVRLLARDLEQHPAGLTADLAEIAARLGVAWNRDRPSTLGRAFARCQMFGVIDVVGGPTTVRVRTHMAPLPRRHLVRLPASLRSRHEFLAGRPLG